jgi:hypothetical protein
MGGSGAHRLRLSHSNATSTPRYVDGPLCGFGPDAMTVAPDGSIFLSSFSAKAVRWISAAPAPSASSSSSSTLLGVGGERTVTTLMGGRFESDAVVRYSHPTVASLQVPVSHTYALCIGPALPAAAGPGATGAGAGACAGAGAGTGAGAGAGASAGTGDRAASGLIGACLWDGWTLSK